MKSDDPNNLLHKLQNVPVELPKHRSVLRKQLMTMHFAWRMTRHSRGITMLLQRTRIAIASHKLVALGLTVASGVVLLLGLLLLLPLSSNTQDRKLLAEGAKTLPATRQTAPAATPCNDNPAGCAAAGQVVPSQPAATTSPPNITLAAVAGPITTPPPTAYPAPRPAPAPSDDPPPAASPPAVQITTEISTPTIELNLPPGILNLPNENAQKNTQRIKALTEHRPLKAGKNKPEES